MHVIVATVPNTVFTNIKGNTTAKGVWDALKALYEGQMMMLLVGLSQQLQTMRCRDDNNVHDHIDKLANL